MNPLSALQQAIKQVSQKVSGAYPKLVNKYAESLAGPAFSNWYQDLTEDFKKRGMIQGMQSSWNPILMNKNIRPFAEPAIGKARVGIHRAREGALDLPFKVATAKDKFKRAVQPNIPFSWDTKAMEPPPIPVRSGPRFDLNRQRQGDSAKMQPYVEKPESDMTRQQVIDYLKSYNVRPAAINYFSQIPVKKGMGYVSAGAGTAYANPDFIGIAPNAPPETLMHEYMHQAPRTIDPRWGASKAFTGMFYPELQMASQDFINRWGSGYMKRPGAMQEEQFAERTYPDFYYRHILEPRGGK